MSDTDMALLDALEEQLDRRFHQAQLSLCEQTLDSLERNAKIIRWMGWLFMFAMAFTGGSLLNWLCSDAATLVQRLLAGGVGGALGGLLARRITRNDDAYTRRVIGEWTNRKEHHKRELERLTKELN